MGVGLGLGVQAAPLGEAAAQIGRMDPGALVLVVVEVVVDLTSMEPVHSVSYHEGSHEKGDPRSRYANAAELEELELVDEDDLGPAAEDELVGVTVNGVIVAAFDGEAAY